MKVYKLEATVLVADDVDAARIWNKLEELGDALAGNVGGVSLQEIPEVTVEELEAAFDEVEPV